MVTTYSGIVPLSGTLFEISASGIFPIISFDSQFDSVDETQLEGNFHSEFFVVGHEYFFTGGSGVPVIFDITNSVDEVQLEGNPRSEVVFINTRFDLSFAPFTTSTGIVVVNFAIDGNMTYVVVPRINSRIFPTDVANATLFPGDAPRGSTPNS